MNTQSHIDPFLMFTGQAEEALNFYVGVFPDSEIVRVARYGPGEPGTAGTVKHALFRLKGQTFRAIDSNIQHGFTFTPALSLYVTCQSEAEIDQCFAKLAEGGQVMMPLGAYPFSRRFGWLADRFGVSWQLTVEAA